MHETGKKMRSRYEEPIGSSVVDATENDGSENRTSIKTASLTISLVPPASLTVILFLVAALTIVIATSVLWRMPLGSGTRQVVMCSFIGMLLSVPVLTSLWAVLGGQTWIIRIPLATFCLLALLGIYLATFHWLDKFAPDEVFLLIAGVALAVFAAIQVPLWVVRVRFGASISRVVSKYEGTSQFTIKQLLITTTVLAFLVPLLQWFATFKTFTTDFPLSEVCGFCSVFIVVLVFTTLLSVLFVFSPKLRFISLGVLVCGLAAVPFVVVPSINYVMGLPFSFTDAYSMDTDKLINIFAFSLSNAVTIIVVLSMYYALGFRLSLLKD